MFNDTFGLLLTELISGPCQDSVQKHSDPHRKTTRASKAPTTTQSGQRGEVFFLSFISQLGSFVPPPFAQHTADAFP